MLQRSFGDVGVGRSAALCVLEDTRERGGPCYRQMMNSRGDAPQAPAPAPFTVSPGDAPRRPTVSPASPRDASQLPPPPTSTSPRPARTRRAATARVQQLRPYGLGLMLSNGYAAEWRKKSGWRVISKTPPVVPAPVTGAGWRIDYELRPSAPEVYDNLHYFNPVPVLYARDVLVAQRAALLVYAAESVLENCVPHGFIAGFDPYCAKPFDSSELEQVEPNLRATLEAQKRLCTAGLEHACRLAAKVSRHKTAQYALLKLLFSYRDCSFHYMALHPEYGTGGLTQSISPSDHVLWARAIVGAFGAIEELGLDIRASSKEPSLVDGRWNSKVLEDLRRRLQEHGIQPDGKLIWAVRGTKRSLARQAATRMLVMNKAPWAKGPIVRDVSVDLVDAINVASWLRSTVSAHRNTTLRRRLSPIDVHNVQLTARRLLLESFSELPPAPQLPERPRVRMLSRQIPAAWAPAPPPPKRAHRARYASPKP